MRKCIYITDDGWWDTDVTILPQIIDDYEITVVVSERLKQLKYEQKNIRGVSKIIKYQTIYRNSDIRKIFKSFTMFLCLEILFAPEINAFFRVSPFIILCTPLM